MKKSTIDDFFRKIAAERRDRFEFYLDARGDYRWRRVAPNGRIVGASSEGYRNRADCVANAQRNGYAGN